MVNGLISVKHTVTTISIFLTLCCWSIVSHAQSGQPPSLEASVERQTVIDGESVLLYIKGENLTEVPDVSGLSKQFDVLDSRRSNSQVMEGGVTKSQFLLRFELLPKNLGQTVIAPFTANGISTQPIAIDVVERGTPGAVPRDKVFAEVTLDKDSVYVQEQVVMSLHVLDDGSLVSLDPPVPVIPGVQVEQLPGGDQRIEARDGEEYRVHTWRYALFPQKQGEIEIPRLLVPGSVRDPSYGGGLILRNMATRRIQIRSAALSFMAEPRAAASTADWWLPVEKLQLQHQWSADISTVTVGEPLTLTLSVTTRGATSNQLPEIEVPSIDGVKIYPDVPALQSQPTEDGLVSQRQEKWSVIPQRAGKISLPAVSIKWWDTLADQEREAVLPAQTLIVSADPEQVIPQPVVNVVSPGVDSIDTKSNAAAAADAQAEPSEHNALAGDRSAEWKTIALLAIFGWITTVVSWLLVSHRNRRKPHRISPRDDNAERLFRELRAASEDENRPQFREQLMAWAARQWPDEKLISPIDIAQKLDSEALFEECQRFEASLYSASGTSADTRKIYRLLESGLKRKDAFKPDADALPSL